MIWIDEQLSMMLLLLLQLELEVNNNKQVATSSKQDEWSGWFETKKTLL